ncbi:MAG: HEAT repeat domain-containing protein [Acidobacteria bacterium]|nr:HEAT repeat domain-containing protein [Acidobacteriota bacterium]
MRHWIPFVLLWVWMGSVGAQQTRQVSVESLIYDLKNPDALRRKEAAQRLGQNKTRAAVPALVEVFADTDDGVRLEILRALVAINDPRALSAYVAASGDQRPEIREKSIAGMVNLYVVEEGGFVQKTRKIIDALNPFDVDYDPLVVEPYVPVSPEAIKALSPMISDPEAGIRRKAAQALGVLRGEEAAPLLLEQLKRESDAGARVQMIRAIGKIGQPQYAAALIPLIEDENKAVHDEAISTVGLLKVGEAVEPLMRLYNAGPEERRKVFKVIPASGKDDLQFKLLDALAFIGAAESQPIFARDLRHKDPEFRRSAAEGLARIGLPESAADQRLKDDSAALLLDQRKEEKKPEVKLAIDFALYRLGNQALLTELINGLDSPRYDQALQYLLEFSPEETPRLFPFVRLKRKKVQIGLITALGSVGADDVRPHLLDLSSDKDISIASAANEALRRLNARVQ